MRKIPKKNYFILFLLAVIVVVVCFVLMNLYNSNRVVTYNSPVKSVINEIKYDDLESYLQENLNIVLYINDSNDSDEKQELDIKKIIMDNNVQQYVVYIEKNDDLTKEYSLDDNSPIFVAYQDGKISEVLSLDLYTEEEVESFLVRNGVIEND